MTVFSHKTDAKRRRDALHASLTAWCRKHRRSRDEFAYELQELSGRRTTSAIIANWLKDSDFREMPPSLDGFWAELTGDMAHFSRRLPQMERESAMREIGAAEYRESRGQR